MSLRTTHGGGLFDFISNAINTVARIAPTVIQTAAHLAPLLAAGIHIRHIEKHLGLKHHLTPIEKKKYSSIKEGSYIDKLEADAKKHNIDLGVDFSKFTENDKKYLAELILRKKRIIEKS